MTKLAMVAIVAAGALTMTACSSAEEGAATNSVNASSEAGALAGDEGASLNDVTAVDSDAAPTNGPDPTPAPPRAGNDIDPIGNAADLTGNGAGPTGHAY